MTRRKEEDSRLDCPRVFLEFFGVDIQPESIKRSQAGRCFDAAHRGSLAVIVHLTSGLQWQ